MDFILLANDLARLMKLLKNTTGKVERRLIEADIARAKNALSPHIDHRNYTRLNPLIVGNVKIWYNCQILKCKFLSS